MQVRTGVYAERVVFPRSGDPGARPASVFDDARRAAAPSVLGERLGERCAEGP